MRNRNQRWSGSGSGGMLVHHRWGTKPAPTLAAVSHRSGRRATADMVLALIPSRLGLLFMIGLAFTVGSGTDLNGRPVGPIPMRYLKMGCDVDRSPDLVNTWQLGECTVAPC